MATSIPEAAYAPPVTNINLLPETADLHSDPIPSARPNGVMGVIAEEEGHEQEHEQKDEELEEPKSILKAGQEDTQDSAQKSEQENKEEEGAQKSEQENKEEEGTQEDTPGVGQQIAEQENDKESGQQGESGESQHTEQYIERYIERYIEQDVEQHVEQHVEQQGEQVQGELQIKQDDVRKVVPVMEEDLVLSTSLPEPEAPKPREPTTTPPKTAKAVARVTKKIISHLPGWTKTNAFITRLNRLLSTSSGTDRALMATSYSLMALTGQIDRLSHYRGLAHSQKAFLAFSRQQEDSHLFALSTHLKNLTSLISDVRVFIRLWGLFGIYEWLVSTLREPPKDKILRRVAYAQISANVLYQIFENLAYLGQHKVLPIGRKKQSSYWMWSSRFWMVHVVLEFLKLKREWELDPKGKEKDQKAVVTEDPMWYNIVGVLKSEGKSSVWLKQLWSNLAYAPLTVHWSLEGGILSPPSVATLGAIAGLIGLSQAWRRTHT